MHRFTAAALVLVMLTALPASAALPPPAPPNVTPAVATVQTLTLRDTVATEGYHVCHYSALFSSGRSLLLNFAIVDKDGKIGGFSGT